MTTVAVNIPAIVDRLGNLKAAVSDLTTEADVLKADLIEFASETGERGLEGQLFRATVSFADKRVTDYRAVLEAIKAIAGIDPDLIESLVEHHTKVAEGVPTVRVSARKA